MIDCSIFRDSLIHSVVQCCIGCELFKVLYYSEEGAVADEGNSSGGNAVLDNSNLILLLH